MSFSTTHAIEERDAEVSQAMQTRDSEALYKLADLYKKEDEDEYAEVLRFTAKKFDREDWTYDESVGN